MKLRSLLIICFIIPAIGNLAFGQKLKLVEGSLDALKAEKSIATSLTFDNMAVGKYKEESAYVNDKKTEYNKNEPGRGDKWAAAWVSDRERIFHPKFDELLEKASGMKVSAKSKYTLVYNTTFTEPGFNIGVMSKNAMISGEAIIIETGNPSKVIARITVTKAPGRTGTGYDFDTGQRISEAYELSGKALGKFIEQAK